MMKTHSTLSTLSPPSPVAEGTFLGTAKDISIKALTLLVVTGGVVIALSSAIFGGMG